MSASKKILVAVLAITVLAACWLLFSCDEIRDYDGSLMTDMQISSIGFAMHSYHAKHGTLPPAVIYDKDGKPLYSWRVLLLPYLDQEDVYRRFKLDEPWDSPHNRELLHETPYPLRGREEPGLTAYQVLVGPGTAFERTGLSFDKDFPDGTGETILIIEAATPVPWSKPADVDYDPNGPLPAGKGGYFRHKSFRCMVFSRMPVFFAGLADGSPRRILTDTNERVFRALITRNGGETLGTADLK